MYDIIHVLSGITSFIYSFDGVPLPRLNDEQLNQTLKGVKLWLKEVEMYIENLCSDGVEELQCASQREFKVNMPKLL